MTKSQNTITSSEASYLFLKQVVFNMITFGLYGFYCLIKTNKQKQLPYRRLLVTSSLLLIVFGATFPFFAKTMQSDISNEPQVTSTCWQQYVMSLDSSHSTWSEGVVYTEHCKREISARDESDAKISRDMRLGGVLFGIWLIGIFSALFYISKVRWLTHPERANTTTGYKFAKAILVGLIVVLVLIFIGGIILLFYQLN